MLRRTAAIGIIAVAGVALVSAALSKGGPPPVAAEDGEFDGKFVWVVLKPEVASGVMLQKVRVRRLGERAFLVGTFVDYTDSGDEPEMTFWVAVDEVKGLTVYNSKADVKKSAALGSKNDKVSAGGSKALPPVPSSPPSDKK